jgi:MYXO-CTERM domain-containing protein
MTFKRFAFALCALSLLWATGAVAHIDMDMGAGDHHLSRYGRTAIKQGPCGMAGGERSDNVYTYAPGETITIGINEYIPHPGYFRIAFDDDGDDDFEDPASIDPKNRACGADETHCGQADYYNNDTVLMDELEWDRPLAFGAAFEYEVTLPDVECDNCTLQVIQVMTDPGKAPYDPSAAGADDLYYQCIDLILQRPDAAGGAGSGDAGTASGGGDEGSGGDDGGCSVAAPGVPRGGTAALLAMGALLLWRRPRRRRG